MLAYSYNLKISYIPEHLITKDKLIIAVTAAATEKVRQKSIRLRNVGLHDKTSQKKSYLLKR